MADTKTEKRIIIIGAGPTGLGAAYRLNMLGYKNWAVYEKEDRIGGLSSSFVDDKGFTWDIGGHVMFSNISDFNHLVETLMGTNYLSHNRESWIRVMNKWIPYPFQNNLHYLPRESILQCLLGLINAEMHPKEIHNFEDWILQRFGEGIARHFMLPYNFKVWAFPPSTMAFKWMAERISLISFEKVLKNVIMKIDDTGWGPNNRFKFPLYGGTGGFFNYFEPFIKEHLCYRHQLDHVDMENRIIAFTNGKEECYDTLINTTPLDLFTKGLHSRKQDTKKLQEYADTLAHNSVYIVGIGLNKPISGTKCWVYFPEEHIPFYRMTYFSHYSPNNVPNGDTAAYSSLMCEISFSSYKIFPENNVISDTIRGLIASGILSQDDEKRIVSTWLHKVDYAYPVPTLERDKALIAIQPVLGNNRIYSRGRFGAWKYEIGNMDHSVMMGMEVVNRILFRTRETIWNL